MRNLFPIKILILFTELLIFSSCNSQVINENPKLVKTQGSNNKGNVHCGLLDKKENLWFGTTGEGVFKYDGKIFRQYTRNEGLSDNTIYSIIEDKNENIWLGTNDGVTRFDGEKFISIPISKSKNAVYSIIQDRNGIIWFGTADGLYCYDGKSFVRFLDNNQILNNNKLSLNSIESILEDKNGNIWFGSYVGEGISFFDGKNLSRFKQNVTLKPFGYVRIMSILEDKYGNIWFGAGDGAYCYDGKSLLKVGQEVGLDWVYSMLEDKNGNIWFTTEKGSGEMDEDGGTWCYNGTAFTHYSTENGLIHNGVFTVVEDASGKLWFGTRNMGLSRFDGISFTQFSE